MSDLNEAVQRRSMPVNATLSDTPTIDPDGDFTPQNRMQEVKSRSRASNYEREYRLKLVHRMLMRNVPLDQIAKELDVSVSTIQRDRAALHKELRKAAQKMDINQIIGDTVGFYGEVQGMGMRMASLTKLPANVRLAAMRTALGARGDMNRFFNASGVFDVLKFRASDDQEDTEMEHLVKMTEAILNDEELGEDNTPDLLQSIANDEEVVII